MGTDTKESLKHELQQVDCVMEKGSENLIKRFISVGGKPEEVIQSLSEGYRGYPQMINLLQTWALSSGMTEDEIHEVIIQHTKKIVKASFDSYKADSIFTQAQAPPAWLEEMVHHKEWRQIIYELSEENPKCLMLSFAIQRIADAGHHDEIGSLTTASQHFNVFNGVVEGTITKLFNAEDWEIPQLLPKFYKLACNSSHTFLYTQSVLSRIIEESTVQIQIIRAKRLSEDLYEHLNLYSGQGQKSWIKIKHLLSKTPRQLVQALEFIITSKSTNPGDMTRIFELYSSDTPPSAKFIQDPTFIDLLVTDLFTKNSIVQQSFLRKYSFILAYATSYRDNDSEEENKKRLKEYSEAIQAVSKLCKQSNPVSTQGFVTLGKQFEAHLESSSVICAGILKYLYGYLTDPNYYITPSVSVSTPIFSYLIRKIILLHPFLRNEVFTLLKHCFLLEPALDAIATLDMKRRVMKQILFLTYSGYVLPVIEQISAWHSSMDHSLIRLFITDLLQNTNPPYSKAFQNSMVDLISQSVCKEALLKSPEAAKSFLKSLGEENTIAIQLIKELENPE